MSAPLITNSTDRCNKERAFGVLRTENHEHHTAMRTLIARTTLILAALFTFGLAHAAEPVRMKNKKAERPALERMLNRALNHTLAYPLMEKADMTGEVLVSFVVNAEGRIQVIECNSSNAPLKAYVLRKLAGIDIGDNPEGSWKTSHMLFKFHPEKA